MTQQDMARIFANIEDIYEIHRENLFNLKKLADRWPWVDRISNEFSKLAPKLNTYGVYVQNFKAADDTLARLEKEEKFKAFMSETLSKIGDVR